MSAVSDANMTFVDLMDIEELVPPKKNGIENEDRRRFRSKSLAYDPGIGSAYGGHVYAQAVWAAAQTVDEGMVVHNVHGYFALPGLTDRPYNFSVTSISTGKSYSMRSVEVRQPQIPTPVPNTAPDELEKLKDPCFVAICSFKKDEVSLTEHQLVSQLSKKYGVVIAGKSPEDHGIAPGIDAPWWYKQDALQPQTNNFPGLEIRQVNMTPYNSSKSPSYYRQLSYYRPIGIIPPTDYNLQACAHLYASDRNSLFVISKALGFGDEVGTMGSISHSVIFHVSSKELALKEGQWWCQEAWAPRSGGGRGLHESRLWDCNGVHVASTWQDGLVRKAQRVEDQKQRLLWLGRIGRAAKITADHVVKGVGGHKL